MKNLNMCSGDYLHKTFCSDEKGTNNCYLNAPFETGTCIDDKLKSKNFGFENFSKNSRCTETD